MPRPVLLTVEWRFSPRLRYRECSGALTLKAEARAGSRDKRSEQGCCLLEQESPS